MPHLGEEAPDPPIPSKKPKRHAPHDTTSEASATHIEDKNPRRGSVRLEPDPHVPDAVSERIA